MAFDFDKIINRKDTYCTQWDYVEDRFGCKDLVSYTISDMDFMIPEPIIKALQKRVEHGIFGYSRWNHDDYKQSIQNWFKKRYATEIESTGIIYGPSAMYMIKTLINFTKQNDTVIVHSPMYDGFSKLLDGLKMDIVEIDFKEDSMEEFHLACKNNPNSIFLLCNPHNPTGHAFSEEELNEYVEICKMYNIFIISDEIHMDFTFGKQHNPIVKIAKKLDYESQVALVTGASKTFNIASLQGAYAIISNEVIREQYMYNLRTIDCLSSPSILGVIATIVGYNECEEWVDALQVYIHQNLEYIKTYIFEHELPISFEVPDSTYFAWLDMEASGKSETELQKELITEGVAIMPGSFYTKDGNYLRLNVGAPRSKIKIAMEAIEKVMKSK